MKPCPGASLCDQHQNHGAHFRPPYLCLYYDPCDGVYASYAPCPFPYPCPCASSVFSPSLRTHFLISHQ